MGVLWEPPLVAMHDGELTISDELVRALLTEQFPRWAGDPVRRVASGGTVNAIFRIGEGLVARFPLVGDDPDQALEVLEAEALSAAEFARCSPVPAPVPVALGAPGPGYPLPWSVQTWLPGTVAGGDDLRHGDRFADDLAELITALRSVDTRGRTFSGSNRGGDLHDHDAWMATCLSRSAGLLDVTTAARMWDGFRDLPRTAPDVMAHGDLVPGNVLVADGRLTGVLDTGGFAAADPALDLVAGWHLLDDGPRARLRAALGCGDLEWERGRAWAFEQAMGLVWYYVDTNRSMSALGRRTLARLEPRTSR